MAKGTNQKLKLIYLTKIMEEKTDDQHSLSMAQILEELEKYEVTAERKSIYNDFADMTDKLGIDIIKEQVGRDTFYHIGSRKFELAEIKLLIDAIQSSKFITEKKSRELISKIKSFVSIYEASQLQRQVFVQGRIKTMNESIYYNVDEIHNALNSNVKIKFKYLRWNADKKLVPCHGGVDFVVSPWALLWDDENYYLIAYDDFSKKIKHYRVDKMLQISLTSDIREGKKEFDKVDMAAYSTMNFSMYQGNITKVRIEFDNSLSGVFIDRFGQDIPIKKLDDTKCETQVSVAVSDQFFGWIFGLGCGARITGPEEVVNKVKEFAQNNLDNYMK